MLETTMMLAAERGVQRRRELLGDPAQSRQARFARVIRLHDAAAGPGEPARSGGGTRAAPGARAFRLQHQPS